MKTQHVLAAIALWLLASGANAYQIVEGRYRVEIAPGVFQDQLVVRCDDGETITVAWETKLAEACGENLMGEPSSQRKVSKSLVDDKVQKAAMLTQVRAQLGNVSERHIEFEPGPDGLTMRFLPPMSDILKKYELCRKSRDAASHCAAERDHALASLSRVEAPAGAVAPSHPAQAELQGETAAAPAPQTAADATPGTFPAPAAPAPVKAAQNPRMHAPASEHAAEARAAAQQKIAAEHSWCMRAKPKYECEQVRARALGAVDKPAAKPAAAKPVKSKHPAKSPTAVKQVNADVRRP